MKSPDEIIEDLIEINGFDSESDLPERVYSCSYFKLEEVCISEISDEWSIDPEKVQEYLDKDISTMPTIVLKKTSKKEYSIIDGTHRLEALKKKKKKTVVAYVGY